MSPRDALITLLLVATTLAWGSAFTGVKVLVRVMDPVDLAILRFLMSGVGYVGLLYWLKRRGTRWTPVRRRHVRWAFVAGAFGVVAYHVSFNVGEDWLTQTASEDVAATLTAFLIATNSIFTLMLVPFVTRESLGSRRVGGILVSLVGIGVLVLWGRGVLVDRASLTGMLIVLIAPLAWAVYSVFTKRVFKGVDPLQWTSMAMLAGTLLLFPFAGTGLVAQTMSLEPVHWLWLLLLSMGATFGGYLAWGYALNHWDASRASTFVYLVPLFGMSIATLVEHERITWQLLAGGALVLAGLWLSNATPRVSPVAARARTA